MSATQKTLIENAESQVRRKGNQLSKYGTLDADDIVNLLDDARWYCGLKGIDFEQCWQRHLERRD
jgi:hypothetical protein